MDAREIEKCIDEFGTDIYRFCLKLCMDKSEAEDLYQQTFLKALEMEWTLDWGQNPKALFFSLTHNLWKSDRRKQARRNMIAPCSNLDDEAEAVLHSDESIEESYMESTDERLDLRHGLGLLIVQQVAAAHNGSFKLTNVFPKGCEAAIIFPYRR